MKAKISLAADASKRSLALASKESVQLEKDLNQLGLSRMQHTESLRQQKELIAEKEKLEEPEEEEDSVVALSSTDEEDEEKEDRRVVEIVSSDEEEEEVGVDRFWGEAEEEKVDEYSLYVTDQDSGLRPLTRRQQDLYAEVMKGPDRDVVAKHPICKDELLRKDLRRIGPGEWLSDEVATDPSFTSLLSIPLHLFLLPSVLIPHPGPKLLSEPHYSSILHPRLYIYIYVYVYMYMCVCISGVSSSVCA
jgi:hypothetical protein